jgi:hypothetical protein
MDQFQFWTREYQFRCEVASEKKRRFTSSMSAFHQCPTVGRLIETRFQRLVTR